MKFRGDYDYTLDAKNRLTVPVKFRAALGGGVILARGLETCVSVWTPVAFDLWTGQVIDALGPLTAKARDFRRVVSATAFETDLDSAGRVMLPSKLIIHAGIDREVAVIGNDEAFEVWDRTRWDEWQALKSPTIPDLTDSIGVDG